MDNQNPIRSEKRRFWINSLGDAIYGANFTRHLLGEPSYQARKKMAYEGVKHRIELSGMDLANPSSDDDRLFAGLLLWETLNDLHGASFSYEEGGKIISQVLKEKRIDLDLDQTLRMYEAGNVLGEAFDTLPDPTKKELAKIVLEKRKKYFWGQAQGKETTVAAIARFLSDGPINEAELAKIIRRLTK